VKGDRELFNYHLDTPPPIIMEDDTDLRMLVMKKAAVGGSGGTPSSMYSPGGYQHDRSRSGITDGPLIQQVGPDFSKLSRDLNRVVLKIQHQSEVSSDCPMHSGGQDYHHHYYDSRRGSQESRRTSRAHEVTHRSSSAEINSGHRLLTPRTSNPEQHYMSLPRRLSSQAGSQSKSSTKVDRRQSFQDFKTFRDKFTGPLDFKSTLRSAGSGSGGGGGGGVTAGPPRREDRSRARKSRHYSEPRDYSQEERRSGYFIESDFDFRSPPSTRDNSRERRSRYGEYDPVRDYYAQDISSGPRRGHMTSNTSKLSSDSKKYQYGYLDLKNQIQSPTESLKSPVMKISVNNQPMSPVSTSKDPLSPRRVEFADELNFNFKSTPVQSRPGSRCESPNPKGILRHTTSDPSQRGTSSRSNTVELGSLEQVTRGGGAKEAVRSNTTDLSFCRPPDTNVRQTLSRPTSLIIPDSGGVRPDNTSSNNNQPLVKIMLPDENNDSDDTLIEEKHETEPSKEHIVQGTEKNDNQEKPKRIVPPPLADWNRSQSFPPAASKNSVAGEIHGLETNLRKTSDPLGMSNSSLLSQGTTRSSLHNDLDLINSDNESLRVRVDDLEKQVHDNNDEIKCLKATLAECLRKIGDIETVVKHSDLRPRRRDQSEGSKSNRKAHITSSIYGSQDFSNRATFEIQVPPQRGTYAPRQR